MTLEIQQGLALLQRQRESLSLKVGLREFRSSAHLGSFQQRLLEEFLPPLTVAIDNRKDQIGKTRTKANLADFILAALGSDELALLTLLSIVYCIADSQQDLVRTGRQSEATLRRTAMHIGKQCSNQFFAEITSESGDGSFESQIESRLMTALKSRQTNRWNARRRADETIEAMKSKEWWTLNRLIAVGGELTHLAMESTGLFVKGYKSLGSDSKKRTAVLRLTEKAAEWLEERRVDRTQKLVDSAILSLSVNLPMIVQPRPWDSLWSGGYLSLDASLVKPNDENYVPDDFYKVERMPAVISAVNALQETAWKINWRVLNAYKTCWDNRSFRAKFFQSKTPLKKAELVAAIETKISVCQYLQDKVFYFPYQVDFRGRVYPVPHILNTQSDDATRSLLQFAEEAPVTDRSEYWTCIHAANSYGLNKLTLDQRHQWCQDHWKQIEELARDPFRQMAFWAEAKEPWGFLAACFELSDIKHGATTTCLPIYVDGKCNGLQHLSAMSRDEHAGEKVNLTNSGVPQDIYQHIANRVQELVASDSGTVAKFWNGKVTRDLVKKPVMTTPYGVTAGGIKEQLKDAAKSVNADSADVKYIATKVEKAIEDVMRGPAEVQAWLQKVAEAVAENGQAIVWTTPSGFRVCQNYRKPLYKRLKAGKFSVRYYLPVDGKRPANKRKQKIGIIANYVHSMDAAHLVKIVNRLSAECSSNIGVVHDSFGVHACHVDAMNRAIREEFITIYSEPVLDKFLEEQSTRFKQGKRKKTEVPKFAAYGSLDIRDVLRSPYFFS